MIYILKNNVSPITEPFSFNFLLFFLLFTYTTGKVIYEFCYRMVLPEISFILYLPCKRGGYLITN